MPMLVIVPAKLRQRSITVINIPIDPQIPSNRHGSIIQKPDETPASMRQPKLPNRRRRHRRAPAPGPGNNEPMLGVTLLRQHQHLVSRRRRTTHPPTCSNPRAQYRQPPRQNPLRLQLHPSRPTRRINRRNHPEPRLPDRHVLRRALSLQSIQELIHHPAPCRLTRCVNPCRTSTCRLTSRTP